MVICCKALVTLIVSLPKFKLSGTMEILGVIGGIDFGHKRVAGRPGQGGLIGRHSDPEMAGEMAGKFVEEVLPVM